MNKTGMQVLAENISMQYNDVGRIIEIFRSYTLEVRSGDKVAIVGESGVGKTTLLNILGGLEQISQGRVIIGDTSITDLLQKGGDIATFRGKNIGFIFQFHFLLPEFDAIENVAIPMLIQNVDFNVAKTKAKHLLERVGLGHRITHRPAALSGGEQQRVAIARAFAGNPGLILADEPTGNLDHKTASEVHKLLLDLHKEMGLTLIIATHSKELASMMDSVIQLTPSNNHGSIT
jgi:lipoprotein-releasing system ATP-binding protein